MRPFLLLIPAICLFGSCAPPYVCPAYQSAFIHDKTALNRQFSYFINDSTPKSYTVRKTKYLIAEPVSYRKRNREMQTVKMVQIYPVLSDSAKLDSLTQAPDSLALAREDSIARFMDQQSGWVKKSVHFRITKTKESYNLDQQYYMWFLRRSIVLPDVRQAVLNGERERALAQQEKAAKSAAPEKKRTAVGRFFKKIADAIKGLFGRKDKDANPSGN